MKIYTYLERRENQHQTISKYQLLFSPNILAMVHDDDDNDNEDDSAV